MRTRVPLILIKFSVNSYGKINAKNKHIIKTLLKKELDLIEANTYAQLCGRFDVVPETIEETTGNVSIEEADHQSEILECLCKL